MSLVTLKTHQTKNIEVVLWNNSTDFSKSVVLTNDKYTDFYKTENWPYAIYNIKNC